MVLLVFLLLSFLLLLLFLFFILLDLVPNLVIAFPPALVYFPNVLGPLFRLVGKVLEVQIRRWVVILVVLSSFPSLAVEVDHLLNLLSPLSHRLLSHGCLLLKVRLQPVEDGGYFLPRCDLAVLMKKVRLCLLCHLSYLLLIESSLANQLCLLPLDLPQRVVEHLLLLLLCSLPGPSPQHTLPLGLSAALSWCLHVLELLLGADPQLPQPLVNLLEPALLADAAKNFGEEVSLDLVLYAIVYLSLRWEHLACRIVSFSVRPQEELHSCLLLESKAALSGARRHLFVPFDCADGRSS
mmetsp:Transcript_9266/g.18789  ORF Transcript_9266/g.18789 Transcript_9266/m.18789 type:complete len:296 (-) Transcript_9266:955-1842(-)